MSDTEPEVWRCHSHQIVNFVRFLVALLVAAAIVTVGVVAAQPLISIGAVLPLGYAAWQWLTVRCRVYELSPDRLRITEGVLNKKDDEMELYRIKDTSLEASFIERLFKLGTLHLVTSDRTHPKISLHSIPEPREFREHLRTHVERLRDEKRAREVDFVDDAEMEG